MLHNHQLLVQFDLRGKKTKALFSIFHFHKGEPVHRGLLLVTLAPRLTQLQLIQTHFCANYPAQEQRRETRSQHPHTGAVILNWQGWKTFLR